MNTQTPLINGKLSELLWEGCTIIEKATTTNKVPYFVMLQCPKGNKVKISTSAGDFYPKYIFCCFTEGQFVQYFSIIATPKKAKKEFFEKARELRFVKL